MLDSVSSVPSVVEDFLRLHPETDSSAASLINVNISTQLPPSTVV
jgi:hypothetical protein